MNNGSKPQELVAHAGRFLLFALAALVAAAGTVAQTLPEHEGERMGAFALSVMGANLACPALLALMAIGGLGSRRALAVLLWFDLLAQTLSARPSAWVVADWVTMTVALSATAVALTSVHGQHLAVFAAAQRRRRLHRWGSGSMHMFVAGGCALVGSSALFALLGIELHRVLWPAAPIPHRLMVRASAVCGTLLAAYALAGIAQHAGRKLRRLFAAELIGGAALVAASWYARHLVPWAGLATLFVLVLGLVVARSVPFESVLEALKRRVE